MYGVFNEEPAKQIIVFLETEGVMYPFERMIDGVSPEWDLRAVRELRSVLESSSNSRRKCKIVMIGKIKKEKTVLQLKEMLEERKYNTFLVDDMEDFMPTENDPDMSKVEEIESYLKQHKDIYNYVIVDNEINSDLELSFPFHCIFTHSKLEKRDCELIERKLCYGNGWENEDTFLRREEINDYFKKVIFLDIDGVLNRDHTSGRDDEEKVEPEFMDNLAEIVRQTDAEIVLTSSWRYGLRNVTREKLTPAKKKLFEAMIDRHLCIAGATPTIMNGPSGRPLEIRTWLSKREKVKSFVILDDEDFWSWNWLSPFVVTTSSYIETEERMKRVAGLDKQYIEPAVRILNQFDKK